MNSHETKIYKLIVTGWLVPAVAILVAISYYVRAWNHLGYRPAYGNPDPKDLEWPIHHMLVLFGFLASYSALLCSGFLSFSLFSRSNNRPACFFLVSTAIVFIGFQFLWKIPACDEFLAWFLD